MTLNKGMMSSNSDEFSGDVRMSKKEIKLELSQSCEELACACQDAWELECGCPLANYFDCPFFGVEKHCHAVTAEMWEAQCIADWEYASAD